MGVNPNSLTGELSAYLQWTQLQEEKWYHSLHTDVVIRTSPGINFASILEPTTLCMAGLENPDTDIF